ncbi:hypothetical protein [Mesorhizobium sp. WSM1293]|uniref:hypothetical protein n=1 Tax=Mesorhizobium sp. WSM1293 TaxID=1040984 RepID=UPI000482C12B|nr:hypothetical protein [Mesorhizobium sp. WSM1293]
MGRLFLDTPADKEKRIDRFIEHMRHAEGVFFASNKRGLPTPRDLLWLLFADAVDTQRQMQNVERRMVSRVGSAMPSSRETEGEAFIRERSRLEDGMAQYDTSEVRIVVHQSAADRMVDIMDLLRFVRAGRQGQDALRYKRTFLAHAGGNGAEFCTRVWDKHRVDIMSRQSLHDIKSRVLGQILAGIEQEFGLVRTSRGFRRLTVREIERRRKERKREENRRRREAQENAG